MYVELIYDKRNVAGLSNAQELIQAELEKRICHVFPDAEVKVKPMQRNAIETDASKGDKAIMARVIEEMFTESDMWLVNE